MMYRTLIWYRDAAGQTPDDAQRACAKPANEYGCQGSGNRGAGDDA